MDGFLSLRALPPDLPQDRRKSAELSAAILFPYNCCPRYRLHHVTL